MSILKPNFSNESKKLNSFLSIFFYALVYLLGSSVILGIMVTIGSMESNYTVMEILTYITNGFSNREIDELYMVAINCYAWTNVLTFVIMAIVVGFLMRAVLIEDFKKIKENILKYVLNVLIFSLALIGVSIICETIIAQFVSNQSENQENVVAMIEYGPFWGLAIMTVLLAPFVEELVFRKSIFILCRNINKQRLRIIVSYIISSLVFALIHMTSFEITTLDWILLTVNYLVMAVMLVATYHLNDENIYSSMAVHLINNLMALLMVVI